jgi:hypothetical protein
MLGAERRRRPLFGAGTAAALAIVTLVTAGLSPTASTAWAYRPFDQTDADVAQLHEVELEIGPLALQRSRDELIAVAPSLVVNYGLAPHIELVAEGRNERAFGSAGAAADHRWRPQELALSIKAVVRQGSLQGERGPSIALEPSILLPGRDQSGVGGQVGVILSTAADAGALHFNVVPGLSRQHAAAGTIALIAEGPRAWRVRPVAEVEYYKERHLAGIPSALGGVIGRGGESWTFDAAVRLERAGQNIVEGRAGFTWSFGW